MAVPKPKARSTLEMVRTDNGNDSLETFVRQAIGKEPLVSLSRSGENPVQWIQLLHALDQQDLPGWPLLTPLKVQMQKCEKCLKEFCSSINYRRHIRVHHRLRNLDKDSSRNRELLRAYWEKLSDDDAKEVLSLKNLVLQEVTESTIIKALTSLVRQSGFYALPQSCLRAGSALLDMVQSRPLRFPLSSDELLSILDDASEKTFLCGPVVSVRKYIFDGEAGKSGLEPKNVVAFTSFLVEQKLVDAWLADKDAEALRCQKLLMEEEEAARQRQVELLKKKKQKKLRHKAKERILNEVEDRLDETFEPILPNLTDELIEREYGAQDPKLTSSSESSSEPCHLENEVDTDISENQMENIDGNIDVDIERYEQKRSIQANTPKHFEKRWDMVSKHQSGTNTLSHCQNHQPPKICNPHKYGFQWEAKFTTGVSSTNRRSTSKPRRDNRDASIRSWQVENESAVQPDNDKKPEVLIGSISVAIGNSRCIGTNNTDGRDGHSYENQSSQDLEKHNSDQLIANRHTTKVWRPVNRNSNGPSVDENTSDYGDGVESSTIDLGTQNSDSCLESEPYKLSCEGAKTFLQRRWMEAIKTDHVELILTRNGDQSQNLNVHNGEEATLPMSDQTTKNCYDNLESHCYTDEHATKRQVNPKNMPEKGVKLMYIPKQTTQ